MNDRKGNASTDRNGEADAKDKFHYLVYFFYASFLVFLAQDIIFGVARDDQDAWGVLDVFALFLFVYFLLQLLQKAINPPEWTGSRIVFDVLEVLFMWWLFALLVQMEMLDEFGLTAAVGNTVYFYFILSWSLLIPVFSRAAGYLEGRATLTNDKGGWALTILALIAAFTPLFSFPNESLAVVILMAVLTFYLLSFVFPVLPAVLSKIVRDG